MANEKNIEETKFEDQDIRGAYLDWASQIAGLPHKPNLDRLRLRGLDVTDSQDLWEPILVSCTVGSGDSFQSFTETLVAAEQKATGHKDPLRIHPFEEAYFQLFYEEGKPFEIIMYRRVGTPARSQFFFKHCEIILIGDLVVLGDVMPTTRLLPPLKPNEHGVAIGIIDDSIGVLHQRFRKTKQETRIKRFWPQTFSRSSSPNFPLDDSDINLYLASPKETEAKTYSRMFEGLYDEQTRRGLERASSHGTSMLDFAAGADFGTGDPMEDIPILAVQLPPEAFDDTSGHRLWFPMLQGLRWLIFQASMHKKLVVNVSLGITAGEKTGRSFLSQIIRRELERVRHLLDVKVVYPYGNAYRQKLIAESSAPLDLNLRLKPNDATPSFLELRSKDPSALRLTVQGPDGTIHMDQTRLAAGRHKTVYLNGAPIFRLYHFKRRLFWYDHEPAYWLLAFQPTVSFYGEPTCPHGRWKITVESEEQQDIVAQIQRDDSLWRNDPLGSQAYFDGPNAHHWSPEERDFKALQDGPITHAGTNNVYSTISNQQPTPNVLSAGGARVLGPNIVPSPYAAEGAPWSGDKPSFSAITEQGHATPGLLAAGTYSESTARFSGTSTASATLCRELVLSGLPRKASPATAESRLGRFTILETAANRTR